MTIIPFSGETRLDAKRGMTDKSKARLGRLLIGTCVGIGGGFWLTHFRAQAKQEAVAEQKLINEDESKVNALTLKDTNMQFDLGHCVVTAQLPGQVTCQTYISEIQADQKVMQGLETSLISEEHARSQDLQRYKDGVWVDPLAGLSFAAASYVLIGLGINAAKEGV